MIQRILASAGLLVLSAAVGGCDKADGFADVAPQAISQSAASVKASSAAPQRPVQTSIASIESVKSENERALQVKAAAVDACLARVHQSQAYKVLDKQATDLRTAIAIDKYQNQSAKMNADWAQLLPILTLINRLEADTVDDDPTARAAVSKAALASAAYSSAMKDQSDRQRQTQAVTSAQAQAASAILPATASPNSPSPVYAPSGVGYDGYSGGSASKSVHVDGYTRKDGTYVHSYNRSTPHSGGGGNRRH